MTGEMTDSRMRASALRSTAALWVMAPLWYLATEAFSASVFPGYNYATNYISDLGVPDQGVVFGRLINSPLHAVMNAGFIGEGLLFLLGLVLLLPHLERKASVTALLIFGAMHAAGIIVVGLVPGWEQNGDNRLLMWHGAGAIAAIAGGNFAAIIAGRAIGAPKALRRAGVVLGVLGVICAVLLVTHVVFPDGVSERGSVYSFIVWQLATGIWMLRLRGGHEVS